MLILSATFIASNISLTCSVSEVNLSSLVVAVDSGTPNIMTFFSFLSIVFFSFATMFDISIFFCLS